MSKENVELVRAVIPPADADIAALVRDDSLFEATIEALAPLLDPGFESVAVWQGGQTYTGVEGLRKLWLDWPELGATYCDPQVEFHSMFAAGGASSQPRIPSCPWYVASVEPLNGAAMKLDVFPRHRPHNIARAQCSEARCLTRVGRARCRFA
jgi:hypothetical protein